MSLEPTDAGQPDVQPVAAASELLEEGERLGHYRVIELIGSGGMGDIYRALDPKLGREVAIKVLRPALAASPEGLVREAQTLARLSHPNVVGVYEVGSAGDRVYVAMELVRGKTLRAWLSERRPWRAIVQAFVAAGRGLAAAHRAGIVHRDFKPDNVLVGEDGRVRVVDFGLAGGGWGPPDATSPALADTVRFSAAVSGTPAYMAPEQYLRQDVDARADQFAFAVSLHEALYRARPFHGDSLEELRRRVLLGTLDPPPASAPRVPPRLHRICKRALELSPARRYPSMEALLADLEHGPSAAWRALALGALAVAVLAALLVARSASGPRCDRGEAHLVGIWDGPTKDAVRAAFRKTGRPSADDTFGRVEKILDGYASAWGDRRLDACHDRKSSAVVFDLRMECLEQRAAAMGQLTTLFAGSPSPDLLDRAVRAASDLGDLSLCDDVAALERRVRPPADPAARARLAALLPRIDHMRIELIAGRAREASELAPAVIAEARALNHAPALAEALYLAADADRELARYAPAEAGLRAVLAEAARAGDDRLAAQAWAKLLTTLNMQSRQRESVALADYALAAAVRAGSTPPLLSSILRATGTAYIGTERPEIAQPLLAQALAVAQLGRASIEVATCASALGIHLFRQRRYPDAEKMLRWSLALHVEALGELHPDTAVVMANLADVLIAEGMGREADEQLARAIAIWERSLGPDHPKIAAALGTRADVARQQGRYEDALAHATRAEAMQIKIFGPDHIKVSTATMARARVLRALTRWDEAYEAYGRAIAILEKFGGQETPVAEGLASMAAVRIMQKRFAEASVLAERGIDIARTGGPDSPTLARVHVIAADAATRQGRPAEALVHLEHARRIYEKVTNAGALPNLAAALVMNSEALMALGRHDEAVAMLRRAIAMHVDPPPRWLAGRRFTLATWIARDDRATALDLARQARAEFVREGALGVAEVAEVDAWLATAAPRRRGVSGRTP